MMVHIASSSTKGVPRGVISICKETALFANENKSDSLINLNNLIVKNPLGNRG
jgi:hypothetical protein